MTFEQLFYRYLGSRAYQTQDAVVRRLYDDGIDPTLLYMVAKAAELYLRRFTSEVYIA